MALFSDPVRRFQLSLAALVILIAGAVVGYMTIEEWTAIDALYMTLITISTVGYGEVIPLTPEGRVFTSGLIVLGIGIATTAISNAINILLGPRLWQSVQQRNLERTLMNIENHYIVCGYGRMGRQIVRDLRARDEPFVIIDAHADMEETFLEEKVPYIIGDATQDEVLLAAGIERAYGLVAALSDDPDNVMTVLSARELNRSIFIVARVTRAESESKLRRAGANRVINPYQIGGHRMALSLLRPAVHDFLDHIFHFGEGPDVDIGQLRVKPGSRLEGQTISGSDLRRVYYISILAISKENGRLITTPGADYMLEANDTLIIIGPPGQIYKLERESPELS